jgi:hypothetical protein
MTIIFSKKVQPLPSFDSMIDALSNQPRTAINAHKDPRGPMRTTVSVHECPQGGTTNLVLSCGHTVSRVNHFHYKVGNPERCFTCASEDR